jgi:hypothetical protein
MSVQDSVFDWLKAGNTGTLTDIATALQVTYTQARNAVNNMRKHRRPICIVGWHYKGTTKAGYHIATYAYGTATDVPRPLGRDKQRAMGIKVADPRNYQSADLEEEEEDDPPFPAPTHRQFTAFPSIFSPAITITAPCRGK